MGGARGQQRHGDPQAACRLAPLRWRQVAADLLRQRQLEHLAWGRVLVCNVYITPASLRPIGCAPDFSSLLSCPGDILIMGDFNAHDTSWYCSTLDERAANWGGENINALDKFSLMVINQSSPVRKLSRGPSSSPDITITKSHLGINAGWEPKNPLKSYHLPIVFNLDGWLSEPPQSGPSCFTKFRKANWQPFTDETNMLSVAYQLQHNTQLVKNFPRSVTSRYIAEHPTCKKKS